jgi:hydroxymethylbilane synthase
VTASEAPATARPVRIGTRASQLALWQAGHVRALVQGLAGAPPVELVEIRTSGDRQAQVPLWQAGGRAFFTREIDEALLAGEVDVAVHSLKDLPTQLEAGLVLAATLPRGDARDALVSRTGAPLRELPRGARIGTSSLRRRAFLARARPDATLLELRGNVPTRLERLRRGDYDAVILAAAGLERLGLKSEISEYLPPKEFPPAVSQGVIGVCARAQDVPTLRWLTPLDDPGARLATCAERALLGGIEGGCQVPVGVVTRIHHNRLYLEASVCTLDGTRLLHASGSADVSLMPGSLAAAAALGEQVAGQLLAQGAAELIAGQRRELAVSAP